MLKTSNGKTRVELEGHDGSIRLMNGSEAITFEANGSAGSLTLGGGVSDGDLIIKNGKGEEVITLKGNTGEINIDGKSIQAADYVFAEGYALMPLQEVESFIQKNNHLPNIPSATDLEQKGLNLNTFTMSLLEKVEELTLHVIALNKEIEELKK